MQNATGYMFTTSLDAPTERPYRLGDNVAEDECRVLSAFTGANFEYPSLLYTELTVNLA